MSIYYPSNKENSPRPETSYRVIFLSFLFSEILNVHSNTIEVFEKRTYIITLIIMKRALSNYSCTTKKKYIYIADKTRDTFERLRRF